MAIISSSDFADVPNLKNLDPSFQALLASYASAYVKKYLRRDIEQATYTEYHSGKGYPFFYLEQYPVDSITSVHMDSLGYYGDKSGAFAAATLLTQGEDYALANPANGQIKKIRGSGRSYDIVAYDYGSGKLAGKRKPSWPQGDGNIKIIYVAGYLAADIPAEITAAATMVAAIMARTLPIGGTVTSESLGAYTYSLAADNASGAAEMVSVRQILAMHRKVSFPGRGL